MSQPVYWVGGVGPHRCPLHELVGMGTWKGCPSPASDPSPRARRGRLKPKGPHGVSVPPPCGQVGHCNGQKQVQQEAKIQPVFCSPRKLPWHSYNHLEERMPFSLSKDTSRCVNCQGYVCPEGPPFPNSRKGDIRVSIRPGFVRDPGAQAAWCTGTGGGQGGAREPCYYSQRSPNAGRLPRGTSARSVHSHSRTTPPRQLSGH